MDQDRRGQFAQAEVEQDFQLGRRTARIPYVRAYAAILGLVLLAYAAVNAMFFDSDEEARFTLMLVPSLVCLGAYLGATFLDRYPRLPIIDFVALLSMAMLVTAANVILYAEMARGGHTAHGNVAVSSLVVTAFAAFAMAGKQRWFLAWVGLHVAGYSALILRLDSDPEAQVYAILAHLAGAGVMIFLNWALGRADRLNYSLGRALEAERAKTEELLYNVLPEAAARRLREGQLVADAYSDASVVFIDVVGFTKLAATVSPGHLIEMLNAFFNLADRCAAEHGIEKVKTIGDAYLAVSGGNMAAANSADSAIAFAEAVIAGLDGVREATGLPVQVRVGIHSGPVVGGVIGATRMAYDYWGDTMNMASRIEGQAQPDGVAVSESTFLRTRRKDLFELPQLVTLKGAGETPVYRIRKPEPPRLALAS